jgi:hypothetical protein
MAFSVPETDVPLVVTTILFTTIATVAVLGRLYIRVIALKVTGVDDYIISVSSKYLLLLLFRYTILAKRWILNALISISNGQHCYTEANTDFS